MNTFFVTINSKYKLIMHVILLSERIGSKYYETIISVEHLMSRVPDTTHICYPILLLLLENKSPVNKTTPSPIVQ